MENGNTNNQSTNQNNKVSAIRTLKDDIAKATGFKKPEMAPTPPPEAPSVEEPKVEPPQPIDPLPPKEEPKIIPETPTINPFVRSNILPFEDGIPPENPKKTAFEVSPIHTYTDDVARAVKTGNTSVIQIAVAEQKEKDEEQKEERVGRSQFGKNIVMFFGSLVFIALGAGIFYYIFYMKPPEKTVTVVENKQIIATEGEKEIVSNNNREKLLEDFKDIVKNSLPISGILNINIVSETTSKKLVAEEFLSLIAKNIPKSLARSFQDDYVFGIYYGEQAAAFIILKVDLFENAFAGMLKWEENMVNDVGGLFLRELLKEKSAVSGLNAVSLLNNNIFKDSIIKNQDVRVIADDQGKIILMYSFINNETLIITENTDTFNGLTDRLRRTQILR